MSNPCGIPVDIEDRIPLQLKKSLTALHSQESKILQQLNSDPKLAQTFITNPAAALKQMGISLDPQLAAALERSSGKPNPLAPKTYKLPDGSKITPTININFVAHKPSKKGAV
jgi:hypothetical protein